jgi:hypothetical protein
VNTPNVKGQLVVDKHPHVVIPDEIELFAAVVDEPHRYFRGEAIVVTLPGPSVAATYSVCGEIIQIFVLVFTG